jgi:DNA polymerase III delta subunit
MKILVLHGEHTLNCYQRLQEIVLKSKKNEWEIERISNNATLSLSEKLSAGNLFQKNALYVLQDLDKVSKRDLNWLKKKNESLEGFLVILIKRKALKSQLDSLPANYQIEEFQLTRYLWKLLDSIAFRNSKETIKLLHIVLKAEPVEFVFSLIAKQVRDLYWVTIDDSSLPYPNWRVGKLKKQASKFTKEQLKNIIHELAELDIKVKTSKANLADSLDFLFASHLE